MKQKEGSVSLPADTQKRKPDEGSETELDLLEMAVKELFEAKSDKERAEAFRVVFQLLEQEPHEENNG